MIEKIVLDNGIRILMEHIPYVRSVTMGIWIETGSRYETEKNSGVSHFLEHMFFKGTTTRSAGEIARAMDMIGGQTNAFTAKECTCFHAKCLDNHTYEAFDILSDMYHNSLFAQSDIDTERGVIKEEINMYEDSPEDLCIDTLHEEMFQKSTLANSILGTETSLDGIDRACMTAYKNSHYTPKNTVISVVGNIHPAELVSYIKKSFGQYQNDFSPLIEETPIYTPTLILKEKDIEQNHVALAFNGVCVDSPHIYSMSVLGNILGGSMSSRLFQEIREKRGLAYSIYSFTTSYKDAGAFTIYAGLNPNAQKETMEIINHELNEFLEKGITEEEFIRGREQIKANLIMGYENISSRMSSMARGELFKGKILTLDETVEKMDTLTMEDVEKIAKQVLCLESVSRSIVGDIDEKLIG